MLCSVNLSSSRSQQLKVSLPCGFCVQVECRATPRGRFFNTNACLIALQVDSTYTCSVNNKLQI